jgi:hypothetical protein
MFSSIQNTISSVFSNNKEENFTNHATGEIVVLSQGPSAGQFIAFLLTMFLYIAIISAVGMYLWNNCAVPLVSIAKPAKSMWQILGLLFLTQLLFN